jgi:Ca2+-binding RTX toxin-like protein
MAYNRGSAKFYGEEYWSPIIGESFVYVDIRSYKNDILDDLDRISTSAVGRNLLNKAITADSLRFVGLLDFQSDRSPAYALNATTGHTIEAVQINYAKTANDLYWFNPTGTLVKGDAALTIAHELAHIVYEQDDPRPLPNESPESFDARQNTATFDSQGPQVRAQNVIARQLGEPDQVRVSYGGAVYGAADLAQFQTGVSYTDGTTIDNVRRGNNGDNNIDHSARTTSLRDLIFGLGGDDTINSGGGNDWLYGGADNDIIRGGAGNDVIYGDDKFDFSAVGDDTLYGDGGNDRIYGGKGTDTIYGGIGVDFIVGGAGGDFITAMRAMTALRFMRQNFISSATNTCHF